MRPVLVVEDDRPTHALLVALVRRCGFESRSAFDGPPALRHIREERQAAVILDLLLPTLDGFQLIAEVSRFAPELLPRIIVVTAASESQMRNYEGLRRTRRIIHTRPTPRRRSPHC